MKQGQLISINGAIYEYGGYDKEYKLHMVYEVEIDESGTLVATYVERTFTTEELENNKTNFTPEQWIGIVEYMLRNDYAWSRVLYNLTADEITEAVEDIVLREFAVSGIPTIEELPQYIAEYLDR